MIIFSSLFDNLSKYKIRRLDIPIFIDPKQDIKELETVLLDYATKNNDILETPTPTIMVHEFREGSIEIKFMVWLANKDFNELKVVIRNEVLALIQSHKLELAHPHLTRLATDKS